MNLPTGSIEQLQRDIESEAEKLRARSTDLKTGSIRGAKAAVPKLHFIPEYQHDFRPWISVRELLQYDGREFIQNAYLALLKRSADSDGEITYLRMLERGISKFEILLRLRLSAEGMKNRTKLKSFFFPGLDWFISRIPILGWIYQILRELILLPRSVRILKLRQELLREQINKIGSSEID